jgi:hypothetical protein
MAGFSFLTGVLPTALSVAGTANRIAQTRRDNKQIKQETKRQQEQYAIQADQDAKARQESLRRAVARQRAAFGGQNIDSNEGSAEAILLGLTAQSDDAQAAQDRLLQLRNQALEQSSQNKQRKNLLSLNQSYDDLRLSSLFKS